MSATDSVTYTLERNWEMVEAATGGLDDEALTRQSAEQSNSIAWIFAHINRVTDMFIQHRLQSKPELWISDGWCQKFGMTHNTGGLGMGQTAEQIAAWVSPAWEVQLGYFEAVKKPHESTYGPLQPQELLLSNLVEIPFQANGRSVRYSRHLVDLAAF